MNRRTFLAGSATLLSALSGGCLAVDDGRKGVILTHVELGNATDEPRQFDVLVTHDGEIIHWALHDVGVGEGDHEAGGSVIEIESPDEFGSVDVHVRVEETWASTDFDTDRYDGERVIAVVTYGMIEDDMLRISRRISDR
jgi:hypothetical protein